MVTTILKQSAHTSAVKVGGLIIGFAFVTLCAFALIKLGGFLMGIPFAAQVFYVAFPRLIPFDEVKPILRASPDLMAAFTISIAIINVIVPKFFYKIGKRTTERNLNEYFGITSEDPAPGVGYSFKSSMKIAFVQTLGAIGGFFSSVAGIFPFRLATRLLIMRLTGNVQLDFSILKELVATIGFCGIMLGSKKIPKQIFGWGQAAGELCTENLIEFTQAAASITVSNVGQAATTRIQQLNDFRVRAMTPRYDAVLTANTSIREEQPREDFAVAARVTWF